MKPVRVCVSLAVLLAILVAFFTVPLPVARVRQTGFVQVDPEYLSKVYLQQSGILEEVRVRDGEMVQPGDILAKFKSFELEQELAQAQVQERIHDLRAKAYAQLKQQASDLNPQDREELDRKTLQAMNDRHQYASRAKDLQRVMDMMLTLRADRAGVVMSPPRVDEIGKYWDAKEQPKPFCSIGEPQKLRVLIPVGPDDYRLLIDDRKDLRDKGNDLTVTLRVQGHDKRTWEGTIAELPQSAAKEVPVQLTTRAGGPLAIKPGSRPGVFEPQAQQYLVAIDVKEPGEAISPGTFAQAKIHCQWHSCGWWTWRTFCSLFDLGMEPTDLLPRLW